MSLNKICSQLEDYIKNSLDEMWAETKKTLIENGGKGHQL